MIKKNIRTLFALGAACINLIMTDVNAYWPETINQQAEVDYYLQVEKGVPLSSFEYFYCDKNPNAISDQFHDERPYSSTSLTNLALPGSADHIVHQFGKELLIIPGNTYQTKVVCRAEPEKQKFFKTVVMPGSRLSEKEVEEAANLFSRVLKLLDLYRPNELEEVLRQEFWQEIVRASDEMQAADAGAGKSDASVGRPDGDGPTYDLSWKSPFPGFGGHGDDDEDSNDDDDSSHGGGGLFESLLVPAKTGGFSEDFGGFWFHDPKPRPDEKKKNRKPKKRYVATVPSSDSPDSSSGTIEVTANPAIENLTVIQFALLVGGFEVNADLQEQLLHLDELSMAELEQLAEGFSDTINNLDSLIEHETIQVSGLSHQQMVKILLKIESLIRQLAGIREVQNDPDISGSLWRIRENLQDLVGSRLIATILGSSQVTVSGDASQHELLVRVLLEADTDDLPETEDVNMEELQDLVDEYIRRVPNGITGEELIRALVEKIEAIQRQIDRREASLGRANGSWLRALGNRLDTLRLELAASEQILKNVTHNYFSAQELFAPRVTDEVMPEPEDKDGDGKGGKSKPPASEGGNSGARGHGGSQRQQRDNAPYQNPPPDDGKRDERDDSGRGGGDSNGEARALESWDESEGRRDMAVWFGEQLREMSLQDTLKEQAGALFFKFESKPEIRDEIIKRIRTLFEQQYPSLVSTLPPKDTTELVGYVKAILSVMRGVALANILFDLAEEEQLAAIRKMYNKYAKGSLAKSIRRSDPIQFPESSEWTVDFRHNDADWSYNLSTGRHEVSEALSQLELTKVLQAGDDGFIRFSPESRERLTHEFLKHPNSGRTPVQFRYVRVSEKTGRPLITRSYDLHRFVELRDRMAQEFPTEREVHGKANPAANSNAQVTQTSQRGGIEDSIQLILNQHPDAAAMLYWLFEPNNSTIPLSQMVFGTQTSEGLLQQRGLPLLTPRSRDQRDLSSQNCEVTVYSNGRMRVQYKVRYDQVSRANHAGQAEHYSAEFDLEFVLDFDISQPEGIRLLNRQFSYKGEIDYSEQERLEVAIAAEEAKQDLKTIEEMKEVPDDLDKLLTEYERYKFAIEDKDSVSKWRHQAAKTFQHAVNKYHSLLTSIRSRNLARYQEFDKAKVRFDNAIKMHNIRERLMIDIGELLAKEEQTFRALTGSSSKARIEQNYRLQDKRPDLSCDTVYQQFETHRMHVQNVLAKLQQIKENLEAQRGLRLSSLVHIHGQVDALSLKLDELNAQYTDRNSDLFMARQELSRAGADVEVFDIFEPANALIGAARLYVAELHVDLDGRQKTIGDGWSAAAKTFNSAKGNKKRREKGRGEKSKSVSSLAIHQVGVSPNESKSRKKSSWRDLFGLFSSGNTSPAILPSVGAQSTSGSVGNLLDVTGLEPSDLTHRRYYQRTFSTDMTMAHHRNTLRAAHSHSDLQRNNVHQVMTPYTPPNSGVSSPGTSLTPYMRHSANYPTGGGLLLGSPVFVGTGGSSASSSYSSSQELNSLGSSSSMPQSRGPVVSHAVHSRSHSDDLERGLPVPISTLRHRPSQQAHVMDTINSPVGSPRSFRPEEHFTMPLTNDENGQSFLGFPSSRHPLTSVYRRSHSTGATPGPEIIVSPEVIPHSMVQGYFWQSVIHLDLLIPNNVPNKALASAVFEQLKRKGMSATDFRDRLSPTGDVYCIYDHFSDYNGWEAVQTYIGEYLRSGRTTRHLATLIFDVFGFDFRKNLEQMYNQARLGEV